MYNLNIILKILIPSIICAFLIYVTGMSINYYPLSFGLIIGLANWSLHKYKSILGVLLSVLVSYGTYFSAYLSMFLIGYLAEKLFKNIFNSETIGIITFSISPYIIAPLLVFLSYRLVFNIPKTKFTRFVIMFSIVFLILYPYLSSKFDLSDNRILNPFTIWQVVMALALQIIITQKSIKKPNYRD